MAKPIELFVQKPFGSVKNATRLHFEEMNRQVIAFQFFTHRISVGN